MGNTSWGRMIGWVFSVSALFFVFYSAISALIIWRLKIAGLEQFINTEVAKDFFRDYIIITGAIAVCYWWVVRKATKLWRVFEYDGKE